MQTYMKMSLVLCQKGFGLVSKLCNWHLFSIYAYIHIYLSSPVHNYSLYIHIYVPQSVKTSLNDI